MEQSTVLTIAEVIALLCISALSLYLIVVLMKMQRIFGNIERDVREITIKMSPVFSNLEAITGKFRSITDNMADDIQMVRFSLRSLRNAIESLVDFEQRVQQKIEEPVMESVSTFAAFVKGVRTFLQFLRIS